jgi:hypothetical protein
MEDKTTVSVYALTSCSKASVQEEHTRAAGPGQVERIELRFRPAESIVSFKVCDETSVSYRYGEGGAVDCTPMKKRGPVKASKFGEESLVWMRRVLREAVQGGWAELVARRGQPVLRVQVAGDWMEFAREPAS